mmetsp:Transcript_18798/g.40910  ORF Transcript_18798/g.40910 Transcript_18798/m.40910 type:complete len:450 (+) Transcript_18798:189-1538(+)
MLAQLTSPSRALRSNYMDALSKSPASTELGAPEVDTDDILSSPESSSPSVGFIEMSDLMLPASALESELFGVPQDSGATVVSTASSYDEVPLDVVTTSTTTITKKKRPSAAERRHSLPSTLMLAQSPLGAEAVTQPVPEFLCHLFSMLRDPSYIDLISWTVPGSDEPDHMGGGIRGIGKIVVHKPESLQDFVLGKYYRHSKYASFQRQLNYFGFKKRLHGGKKGKLSPCSYIHESLTDDVGSLFTLKRRPPAKKRTSEDVDCEGNASSHDEADNSTSPSKSKKRRVTVDKKSKKSSSNKNRNKKDKKHKSQGKQLLPVKPIPHQVEAEEYGPPMMSQSSDAIEPNQLQTQPIVTTSSKTVTATNTFTHKLQVSQPPTTLSNQSASEPSEPQPTLLELLSTSLPPSHILFSDDVDVHSTDNEGVPAWITDDGKYHYHNVDSSLVDLAMIY